jgi:hypothetical protein
MSRHRELTPLVPVAYTLLPAYGRVPDPITLFDAAALIARDPAGGGRSHAEIYAGLIGAFWRGDFEGREPRSLVFTLEAPRIRYHSEPEQKPDMILVSPPPGPWVGTDGLVYTEREDGRVVRVRRRPVPWTRQDVLATLARSRSLPDIHAPLSGLRPTGSSPSCRSRHGRSTLALSSGIVSAFRLTTRPAG